MLIIDSRKVRHLMVDKGIKSVFQLAQLCKPPLAPNSLYLTLNQNRSFDSDTADRLAAALGVSAFEILSEVPNEVKLQDQAQ